MTHSENLAGPRVTITERPVIVRIDREYSLIHRRGVHRLLVTSSRAEPWMLGLHSLNPIQQRGLTLFCTAMDEDLDEAVRCARRRGVTVQQMTDNDQAEEWLLIVQGSEKAWEPPAKKGAAHHAPGY